MSNHRPIPRNAKGPALAVAPLPSTGGEDLSALIALTESQLATSGLAQPKEGGGKRQWAIADPATLRRYMGRAVWASDGPDEYAALNRAVAGSTAPFLGYRSQMSDRALYRLYRYLRFRSYLLTREATK